MSARADFRPVSADFRPERADFRPERADFRLQGLISGLRARFQAFWGRGAGGGSEGETYQNLSLHSTGYWPFCCPKMILGQEL